MRSSPELLGPMKPRRFYGWVVIAIAFVTMAIIVNSRTAFSLLFPALLDEFGWPRGVIAAAFSVGFVASTMFLPVIGVLMDRFGPRLVIPCGAALVALGYAATPFVTSVPGLYVTLGLMAVSGSIASSFLCHSMFLPHWFVRRRGLAIGVAFSGVGIGSMLILPAFQALIDGAGWRSACFALAGLVAVVVIPLNLLFQRRRPEDVGQQPDGDGAHTAQQLAALPRPDPVVDRAWADTDWTLGRALRTGRFWWVFGAYFTALFAWYAVQVHQTRYLVESGFDSSVAATALGLVGLCGIAGQIGLGQFSDRVGREWTWSVAMAGYIACYGLLIALGSFPSGWLLYLMVATQGLLGYGIASIYGAVTAELFMGRHYATVFSVTSLGGNIGAAVGPWLFGVIFDTGGSYLPAFWLAIGGCAVSVVCIWRAAPRKVRLVAGIAARRAGEAKA